MKLAKPGPVFSVKTKWGLGVFWGGHVGGVHSQKDKEGKEEKEEEEEKKKNK